jgi:hypothetical protein
MKIAAAEALAAVVADQLNPSPLTPVSPRSPPSSRGSRPRGGRRPPVTVIGGEVNGLHDITYQDTLISLRES